MDDLQIAVEAAVAAGQLLRAGRAREAVTKEDRTSIVTEADLAAQEVIVATIRTARPDDAILGEEGTSGDVSAHRAWIVDPIDGTTNYAHGFPFSCVSVALREGDEVTAAAVCAPGLDEVFAARRGGGATRNGRAIRASVTSELAVALVATGLQSADPTRIGAHIERLRRLHGTARGVRMPGSPALSLCHVACGQLDAFLEEGLQPWDIAAGLLMVSEAGGRLTDFDGEPLGLRERTAIVASNERLHDPLLALIGTASSDELPARALASDHARR